MAITVKTGATIAPTGGTDVVYTLVSSNGNTDLFENLAQADYRLRERLEVKTVRARPNATSPNAYTQNRCSFYFKHPKLLANGLVTVNGSKHEVHFDVEATAAEVQKLLDAQGLACTQSAISAILKLAAKAS